ncbi:MAG TPA: M56 family metallopeptidase [Chitinophagaceae bacterium]|nr:M56 family metallopeptidase [Chitinophagaceae bacterium]
MIALGQSDVLQALGWAVLNSLWQMALLWVVYNLLLGMGWWKRPAQKNNTALLLLVAGFAWFTITFFRILLSEGQHSPLVTVRALPGQANQQLNQWLENALPYASLLYLLLLIVPVIRFTRNYRFVQTLRSQQLHKIPAEWRVFVKKIAQRIGIKTPVQIWVSGLITSPVTIGYLKPVILVPLAAIAQLTPQQLEAVLLHELAHIRRHDYFINLVIHFIQSVLYFNPFVKQFVKTIEREREKSCDEMVMQFQYDPYGYASALLTLEKNNYITHQMAIAASGKNDLLHRIERIMGVEKTPVFSFNRLAGLFASLLCVILINAVLTTKQPLSKTGSFAFAASRSPLFHFSTEENSAGNQPVVTATGQERQDIPAPTVLNHIGSEQTSQPIATPRKIPAVPAKVDNQAITREENMVTMLPETPGARTVTLNTVVLPKLNKAEQRQVEKTVAATKKVLEATRWKQAELTIADVLTTAEKEQLKAQYHQQINQVNWEKLAQQLQLSYDQINWEHVTGKLDAALTGIQLDSLEQLYNKAELELARAEQLAQIANDSLNIQLPVPDISLEQLTKSRLQLQKNMKTIRLLRSKKIVRL